VVRHNAVETLRNILGERNVTFQRTRSWKRSTDPEFEEKASRILALYRTCPADGVVISFDEFGPISLQPYPGQCYAQRKRPWRRRATYVRRGGVGYFLGAYDVHADVLFAAIAWPRPPMRCWPSISRSAGVIPIICASTSSTTTCRCTGRR
jgi:hypothetical protein